MVEVWYRAGVYLWLLRDKAAGLRVLWSGRKVAWRQEVAIAL